MYECYDCRETFNNYGDCPYCSSTNIGMLSEGEDDELVYSDYDEYDDDYDDEIDDVLKDVGYDDEEFDDDDEEFDDDDDDDLD
jgi:hypothetical protein